jgi:voltage-gated potassium channel
MKLRRDPSPGRAAHRRSVLASVLRAAAAVSLLVFVYYQAPLDQTRALGIWFLVGLAGLAVLVVLQIRAIIASNFPRLRAIETVAVWVPALLMLDASTYTVMSAADPGGFSEVLDRTDSLYFTMTVFATVGFGDIVPVSEVARIVTTTQMVVGLITVGVVAKVVLGAVQVAVEGRSAARAEPSTAKLDNPDMTGPGLDNDVTDSHRG